MRLLKSEKDYDKALSRLDELFDAKPTSIKGEEAEVLALLIEDYEKENCPISSPDPIVAIKIRMEKLNLKQKDLVEEIGGKSIVSEILNKRRKLTVKMIRNLSSRLKITTDVLVQDYQLNV